MSAQLDTMALDPARLADVQHWDRALPWNLQRDPELSREAPAYPGRPGYAAAERAFLAAVQDGRDVMLPAERGAGRSLTTHLGECSTAGRELLLKACTEAMAGRAHTAAEMLRDFVRAEAADYADDSEECFL